MAFHSSVALLTAKTERSQGQSHRVSIREWRHPHQQQYGEKANNKTETCGFVLTGEVNINTSWVFGLGKPRCLKAVVNEMKQLKMWFS